jgi:hypothetical protein
MMPKIGQKDTWKSAASAKTREIIRSDLPKKEGYRFAAKFDGEPALEADVAKWSAIPKIGKELGRSQSYKTRQNERRKRRYRVGPVDEGLMNYQDVSTHFLNCVSTVLYQIKSWKRMSDKF